MPDQTTKTSRPIKTPELASQLARDPELKESITSDIIRGLTSFISNREECIRLATGIVSALEDPKEGISKARTIVEPYRERFWETFRARSAGIFENIKPVFGEMAVTFPGDEQLQCFDWGTGKGRFPTMIEGAFPRWTVSGGDVLDYRDTKNFPFLPIQDNKVPELPSDSQDAVLLSYVLHHEANPAEIIAEIDRILAPGGRVVVIELCVRGDSVEALEHDRKRVLFSDLVYCVVWQDEDIPMPGTYKSPLSWCDHFEPQGFNLIKDTPIAGTPLIYGDRHLMVFEKPSLGMLSRRPWGDLSLPTIESVSKDVVDYVGDAV